MLTPVKNYPALLYQRKGHRTLIIADLHLGWEMNLARRGIYIPSQSHKILQKLLHLISTTHPKTLMILGDVKDTIAKAESGEWKDIPEFFETLTTKISDIQIIRGNHDGNLEPLLPPTVKLHPSTGIAVDTTGVFHGHTWPSRKLANCATLVMGHVHPTIAFRDRLGFLITTPVWIKAKIDPKKFHIAYMKRRRNKTTANNPMQPKVKQLFIMPCFNDFLGGRPINRKRERSYIGPILRSDAVNINNGHAYLLDGTFLGTVDQLKNA
jgi:hypothetical protein